MLHPSSANEFNADRGLLSSDVTFHVASVSLWIRMPKIQKSPLGDTVEIWEVENRPDLDPIKALKTYISLRNTAFGVAEHLPLFKGIRTSLLQNGVK